MFKDKKKAKPLAFYEDVFVYDTLQWEDEFTPLDDDKNQNIKTTQPEQTHSNQSQASQPPNHHHHHLNNNISNNNHNHNNNIINSIKTADLFNNSNLGLNYFNLLTTLHSHSLILTIKLFCTHIFISLLILFLYTHILKICL